MTRIQPDHGAARQRCTEAGGAALGGHGAASTSAVKRLVALLLVLPVLGACG